MRLGIPPSQTQTRQKELLPVQGNNGSKVDKIAEMKEQ